MVKLINEDCFEILQSIERNSIDCVICDPPYNIGYTEWDESFDLSKVVELIKPLLKDNANIILFQGWTNVASTKLLLDEHFNICNWIVWDRLKGRGATNNLMSTREDILWYCNGTNPTYNKIYSNIFKKTTSQMGLKNGQSTRALTNVWYDLSPIVPWSKEKTSHPTQKPLDLMERCVSIWTNPGDIVLDFTMGSGSTGVACLNLNRSFIGIEIDKEYFTTAKTRMFGTTKNKSNIFGVTSDIIEEGNSVTKL